MIRKLGGGILTLMGVMLVAGCAPTDVRDASVERALSRELQGFHSRYVAVPVSYEGVKAAKDELDAIGTRVVRAKGAEAGPLLAHAGYEALASGEVLTYADFLIVWRWGRILAQYPPQNREVALGIAHKLQTRSKAVFPDEVLDECCGMFLEVLSKHIPGIEGGILTPGKIDWAEWSSFEKAITDWTPPARTE